MKKIIILTCLLITFAARAQGPSSSYLASIPLPILPSLQSQVFEKYLNHQITEYNGLPEINIPLYEVQIKGVTIPIVLSYYAGGIKYKQYDGEVGAGWSVNAGGFRVMRSVCGRPDEVFPMYSQSDANYYLSQSNEFYSKNAFLGSLADSKNASQIAYWRNLALKDGEYDQFSYMTPSSNGHFIITNRSTKETDIIERNQDKVILDEGLSQLALNYITVLDNNGNIYNFGKKPNNTLISEIDRMGYKTSWPLTKILTQNNEEINFTYKNYQLETIVNQFRQPSISVQDAYIDNLDPYSDAKFYSYSGDPYLNVGCDIMLFVETIETETEQIVFERFDNTDQYKKHMIKSIKILSKLDNKTIKTITFNYKDRTTASWHTLLESVKVNEKVYKFDYYGHTHNRVKDTYPDQWGYYMPTITSRYQDIFIHKELEDFEILKRSGGQYEVAKLRNLSDITSLYHFTQRSTVDNLYSTKYYSLQKITFPTGGTTEYEYEPNQYRDLAKNTTIKGGGQRVKQITSKTDANATPIATVFKYGENEDGNGIPTFVLNNRYFTDKSFHFILPSSSVNPNYASLQISHVLSMNQIAIDMPDFGVSYSKVTTYKYIGTSSQAQYGYTVSTYNIPTKYIEDDSLDEFAELSHKKDFFSYPSAENYSHYKRVFIEEYKSGYKPTLNTRVVRNSSGNKVSEEEYSYMDTRGTQSYEGTKVRQRMYFDKYHELASFDNMKHSTYVNSMFDYNHYSIVAGSKIPYRKTTTIYDINGNNPVTTTENYEYYDNNQLKKTTQTSSTSGSLTTEFKYPWHFSDAVYQNMNTKNMLAPVIEKIGVNGTTEIGRMTINYVTFSGMYLPSNVQTSSNSTTRTVITYDRYDYYGNPGQVTGLDDKPVIYLWSYKGKYLIAEIRNATYTQVESAVSSAFNKTIDSLSQTSYSESNSETLKTVLNNLRDNSNLSSALITTYTFKPLVGMLTSTDPAGNTNYYEYDSFNRLSRIYIKDGSTERTIQQFNYNYVPI